MYRKNLGCSTSCTEMLHCSVHTTLMLQAKLIYLIYAAAYKGSIPLKKNGIL